MRRRTFFERVIQGSTVAAASHFMTTSKISAQNIPGANERINLALIGCGGRGRSVANLMRQVPNTAYIGLCDVYARNAQTAREAFGAEGAQVHADFRRVLDRNDIHAVHIATPDHWHAATTVLACLAGKDVYCEKPLSHTIREGRVMVDTARRTNRIVQTGTQHRSAPHYAEIERIIQSGELGHVHFVRVWNYLNIFPGGLPRRPDGNQPEGLDWDMYLGPAPQVPFNQNRFLSTFRWFWDYAGGFLTDWGTHRLDSVRQVMHCPAPLSVTAAGGSYDMNDAAETPALVQATYQFPDFILSYESNRFNSFGTGGQLPGRRYYGATQGGNDHPHGEAFYGTNGTIISDRLGFEVYSEPVREGRRPTERRQVAGADRTDLHTRNFIDCVRSRQRPNADVEIGHKSTTLPLLGNIAYRTGRKIRWNDEREEIVDDREASALLRREPRRPWNLIEV